MYFNYLQQDSLPGEELRAFLFFSQVVQPLRQRGHDALKFPQMLAELEEGLMVAPGVFPEFIPQNAKLFIE